MGYYRNYRRPYYYSRNSYYRRRRPINPKNLLIGLAVLFVIGLASNFKAFLDSLLFPIILYGGIGFVVWKLVKRRKKLGDSSKLSDLQVGAAKRDDAEINSEKHGCKCYMEGLSCGEQEVADTLSRELGYKDYFIFNNLIIPSENRGSTQIDHIVVSKFGIFVIESKDYSGWIFGEKDQTFWTQSLPGGKNKFQFQNPIHQNYAHIMALKALMPFAADSFYSIVVFSDKSEIKTAPIENVVYLSQLIGCIKKYTQEKLTENDTQLVIGKLSYACQTVDITTSEHIVNLNTHQPA